MTIQGDCVMWWMLVAVAMVGEEVFRVIGEGGMSCRGCGGMEVIFEVVKVGGGITGNRGWYWDRGLNINRNVCWCGLWCSYIGDGSPGSV